MTDRKIKTIDDVLYIKQGLTSIETIPEAFWTSGGIIESLAET
jgi:hypothetical protein